MIMAGCAQSSSIEEDFELLTLSEEDSESSISSPDTATGQSTNDENKLDYRMDHANRGKCVVFNHEYFLNLDQRRGTHLDVQRITQTFEKLDFTVEVHHDYEHNAIMNKTKELSEEDHSDNDCLVIFVLIHGEDSSRIHARNMLYDMENLWKPFTPNRCITLAGKPKLFFFSACRGQRRDNGVILHTTERTETDGPGTSYVVPNEADFLYGFSTPPGYVSHREPNNGTWFIQVLCSALDQYAATMDLQTILTITAGVMTGRTNESTQPPQKQVSEVTTKLTRRVFFKPKKRTE